MWHGRSVSKLPNRWWNLGLIWSCLQGQLITWNQSKPISKGRAQSTVRCLRTADTYECEVVDLKQYQDNGHMKSYQIPNRIGLVFAGPDDSVEESGVGYCTSPLNPEHFWKTFRREMWNIFIETDSWREEKTSVLICPCQSITNDSSVVYMLSTAALKMGKEMTKDLSKHIVSTILSWIYGLWTNIQYLHIIYVHTFSEKLSTTPSLEREDF